MERAGVVVIRNERRVGVEGYEGQVEKNVVSRGEN